MLRRIRREVRPVQEDEEEEEGDGDDDDSGQGKGLDKNLKEASKKDEGGLSVALKSLFRCTTCSSLLPPPAHLYQVGSISYFCCIITLCLCFIPSFCSVRGWPPTMSALQEEPRCQGGRFLQITDQISGWENGKFFVCLENITYPISGWEILCGYNHAKYVKMTQILASVFSEFQTMISLPRSVLNALFPWMVGTSLWKPLLSLYLPLITKRTSL